jgi:integrase
MLTVLEVENLSKVGRHADSNGLYLEIDKQFNKRWVYRYQLNNHRRWCGLGGYDKKANTLAMARNAATEAKLLVSRGIHPTDHKASIREQEAANAQLKKNESRRVQDTFAACALDWIARKESEWSNPKHRAQIKNTLTTYAFPVIGDKPVADITVEDVKQCLDPIWGTKTETASRVRQRMESVFSYAIASGKRTMQNPAQWRGLLENFYGSPEKVKRNQRIADGSDGHFSALPYQQMPAFAVALEGRKGVAALALKFTILTAMRTGSVRFAKWEQVDLDKCIWTVPPAHMKNKKEFRVALSSHCCSLLVELPRVGDYVFPGGKIGKPLSNGGMLSLLKRMGRTDITVHGFRSTFRDYIGEETSYDYRLAEFALAHTLSSSTEQAYARGDLLEKRYDMMECWGDYCASGANQ